MDFHGRPRLAHSDVPSKGRHWRWFGNICSKTDLLGHWLNLTKKSPKLKKVFATERNSLRPSTSLHCYEGMQIWWNHSTVCLRPSCGTYCKVHKQRSWTHADHRLPIQQVILLVSYSTLILWYHTAIIVFYFGRSRSIHGLLVIALVDGLHLREPGLNPGGHTKFLASVQSCSGLFPRLGLILRITFLCSL